MVKADGHFMILVRLPYKNIIGDLYISDLFVHLSQFQVEAKRGFERKDILQRAFLRYYSCHRKSPIFKAVQV